MEEATKARRESDRNGGKRVFRVFKNCRISSLINDVNTSSSSSSSPAVGVSPPGPLWAVIRCLNMASGGSLELQPLHRALGQRAGAAAPTGLHSLVSVRR